MSAKSSTMDPVDPTTTWAKVHRSADTADPAKLSVIMPAHNEERTIGLAVHDVLDLQVAFNLELVVIDDGSTDATALLLETIDDDRLTIYRQPANLGKGSAVLAGVALATGTHLVIFDADREYFATDLPRMFEPILQGRTDVVFGSRCVGMNTVYQSFRYAMGNRATTLVANLLYDAALSDLHTCLKMMPLDLFRQLDLEQRGFGLDSEITAELLRRGYRPFEVPVSYLSRSHTQGKKLTWRDGLDCLAVLGRVRLRGKTSLPAEHHGLRGSRLHDDHAHGDHVIDLSSDRTIDGSDTDDIVVLS